MASTNRRLNSIRNSLNFSHRSDGGRSSFKSVGSKRVKSPKVATKLGSDFVNHWENLDKTANEKTFQLEEVREMVKRGIVSEKVYEEIVRVNKEKLLGTRKREVIADEWEDKPIIQGHLFKRTKSRLGGYSWIKHYFVLYRNKLVWYKKKENQKKKDPLGEIILTADFNVSDWFNQRAKANSKYRNTFTLQTLEVSYEFAAETPALKTYWFHTLGLSLKRIKDRYNQTDEPLLMTHKPKVHGLTSEAAMSERQKNYRTSVANLDSVRSGSVNGSQRKFNPPQKMSSVRSSIKSNNFEIPKVPTMIPNKPAKLEGPKRSTMISISQSQPQRKNTANQAIVNTVKQVPSTRHTHLSSQNHNNLLQETTSQRTGQTKQVLRLQYVSKDKYSAALEAEDPYRESPPLLEVGPVEYDSQKLQRKERQNSMHADKVLVQKSSFNSVDSIDVAKPKSVDDEDEGRNETAHIEDQAENYAPVEDLDDKDSEELRLETEKLVQDELGLRVRTESYDNQIILSLDEVIKLEAVEEEKKNQAARALDVLDFQDEMIKKELDKAIESDDQSGKKKWEEARARGKDARKAEEEKLAQAAMKKEEYSEIRHKKEKERAQNAVSKEIVNELVKETKASRKNVLSEQNLRKSIDTDIAKIEAEMFGHEKDGEVAKKVPENEVKAAVIVEKAAEDKKVEPTIKEQMVAAKLKAKDLEQQALEASKKAQEAAKRVYERNEKRGDELEVQAESAANELEKARAMEKQRIADVEKARDLHRSAMTKSLRLKAESIFKNAEAARLQATKLREEKEDDLKKMVADKLSARLQAIEVKQALSQQRREARRQSKRKSPKRKTTVGESQRISVPKVQHVSATKALADFIAANAAKVAQFVSSSGNESFESEMLEAEKNDEQDQNFVSPEANFVPENKNDGKYEYDDLTESFYSDEEYPDVDQLEGLEGNENGGEPIKPVDYFQEKTKHVSSNIKKRLSRVFMNQEVIKLARVISQTGDLDKNGHFYVTFGKLAETYKTISDNLVGTLMLAKKQNKVDFPGDVLSIDENGDTIITLLL